MEGISWVGDARYLMVSVIIFTLWADIGYNVILFSAGIDGIPGNLYESAKLDGAGELRIYAQLYMPLATPLLATLGLFSALGYWNDWYNSMLFISKDECKSLQYFLQEMLNSMQALKNLVNSGMDVSQISRNLPQETLKMAMTMITTGPIILLYPFVQRFFIKGLVIGAVKG